MLNVKCMWNANSFSTRVCCQHTHSVFIKYFNLISSSSTPLHYWKENYIDQSFIQFIIAAININQRPVCPRTVLIIRANGAALQNAPITVVWHGSRVSVAALVQPPARSAVKVLIEYNCNHFFFLDGKLWIPCEGKSVFSSCCHSRKKAVGRLKFCQVYFFCRHHHRPAAVFSFSCLRLTVFHYLRCNICHGFWDPLSHFCSGVSIYGPTQLLFQI